MKEKKLSLSLLCLITLWGIDAACLRHFLCDFKKLINVASISHNFSK